MSALLAPQKKSPKIKGKASPNKAFIASVFIDPKTYLNDPQLIDETNFKSWFKLIHDHSYKGYYCDTVTYLMSTARPEHQRLPPDYRQRLIIRQLAQGIYIRPDILSSHNIKFYQYLDIDGYEVRADKVIRRPHEYRQPISPFDFVKIDPDLAFDYKNMQLFFDSMTAKPNCSNAKDGIELIRSRMSAITYPYITPYHPCVTGAMIFDVDCKDRDGIFTFEIWKEYNLPPPNIIIKNPLKESYHFIYLLRDPVCNWGEISRKFIYKFDCIYEAIREKIDADPCFNGRRIKNPFSHEHDTFVSGAEPYTLDELADKADLNYDPTLPKEPRQVEYKGNKSKRTHSTKFNPDGYMGRNCAIFDCVRWIGYDNEHLPQQQLYELLLRECKQFNELHYKHDPLPHREMRDIAKSIAKYCKSNNKDWNRPDRVAKRKQVARDNVAKANANGACSKGGQARSASYDPKRTLANEMHLQGLKNKVIAEKLGVTTKTLRNWGIFAKKG